MQQEIQGIRQTCYDIDGHSCMPRKSRDKFYQTLCGAFQLAKISGISGSAVNGTRFVDSVPLENSQKKWKI